jgi:hypothetical protein
VNPLAKIPEVKIPGLSFQVVEITPVLAAEWLKRNRKNRKVKNLTVEAYARDMKNDAWYLTHQGVAFDADGNLIDGQHRLQAVVSAKRNVAMFVTSGWPANGKQKTMDAVDRGVNRSLADQLSLQHDVTDAARVVQMANSVAAACLGGVRVRKSSTHCVLSVFDLYQAEFKYLLADPIKQHGLKSATVAGVLILARAVWPEKTADFINRFKTGENLDRNNPILHLRNWLMGVGMNADAGTIRLTTAHHLVAFVEDRNLQSLVSQSNVALLQLLKLQGDRVAKIRKLYDAEAATVINPNAAAAKPAKPVAPTVSPEPKFNISPTGPDALRVAATLAPVFSTTDLVARVDSPNIPGLWLADWNRRGWIVSAGVREFRKTDTFGK